MFITTDTAIELSTISPISILTSGNVYFYQNFNLKQS
jgi:hypothetical protein